MIAQVPSLYSTLSHLPLTLPSTFVSWKAGTNLISTAPQIVAALVIYLMLIFGGRYIMADLKPRRESMAMHFPLISCTAAASQLAPTLLS